MAIQSFSPGDHIGHLWGDVAALYIVAGWRFLCLESRMHNKAGHYRAFGAVLATLRYASPPHRA